MSFSPEEYLGALGLGLSPFTAQTVKAETPLVLHAIPQQVAPATSGGAVGAGAGLLAGLATGAASGAVYGSSVPVLGTAVGAVVGAAVGTAIGVIHSLLSRGSSKASRTALFQSSLSEAQQHLTVGLSTSLAAAEQVLASFQQLSDEVDGLANPDAEAALAAAWTQVQPVQVSVLRLAKSLHDYERDQDSLSPNDLTAVPALEASVRELDALRLALIPARGSVQRLELSLPTWSRRT